MLFSKILGNLYIFPENLQGNIRASCKDNSAYKVSILHCYVYSHVFLLAPQLIFSRKMEVNSSTLGNQPYVQPVVVGQPWDMFPGGDLTMSELQRRACPSPVPQTGEVSASGSAQTSALLRRADSLDTSEIW